ncbi:sigma-70 family RNA polymerase sigma factor [Pseudonocardia xishanensis]|uniref:Sigma-70 family RNA polymerase sigma factor n=1 Tax=Pseudonocardia xishanensis TaxID=630995 RepID=A0ABP8RCT9_9PSEU
MYQGQESARAGDTGGAVGVEDRIDQLVDPARAGDDGALTELLELVRPMIVRYCETRLKGSAVSAEDVTQEVCLALLRSLPAYEDRGRPFLAFVRTVASHRIASACTSATRTHEYAVADPPQELACCDPCDEPEQHLLELATGDEVAELLARLPARPRDILVLRVAWGLSAREVAELLGLKPETVRLVQHRALNSLRRTLSERGGPD